MVTRGDIQDLKPSLLVPKSATQLFFCDMSFRTYPNQPPEDNLKKSVHHRKEGYRKMPSGESSDSVQLFIDANKLFSFYPQNNPEIDDHESIFTVEEKKA